MTKHRLLKLSSFVVTSTLCSMSYASGFAIIEQSVTGLGSAFAGSAAVAEDASTIFFNPAGLTYLSHSQLAAGLNLINPEADFHDQGSNAPALSGLPLGGIDDDGGKLAVVPNLYYAHRLNDSTVAGIGINAPFGLVTDYSDNWVGRYNAIKSDLKTININPSIAFKANEKLSLGFGVDLQYIDLELTQAVDFGTICAVASAPCAAPLANDGKAKVTADDWSWGYNLGLIYQATEATRVGIAYRSKISHNLTGKGVFSVPSNAQTVASLAGFTNGHISGGVTLPENLSLAIHHQVNKQWAIMADASWTRWSRFQDLTISSTDSSRLNSSKEEKWDNTMRYGLGLTYSYNDKWTFRSGIAYDETPISDQYRTPRIPGNDRKWVSLGASYKASEKLTIDAGYTHLFVSNTRVSDHTTDTLSHTLIGEYDASVDILSVQMRWIFL